MNHITRRAALGASLAVPFVRGAAAQERFPNKPITIYVLSIIMKDESTHT